MTIERFSPSAEFTETPPDRTHLVAEDNQHLGYGVGEAEEWVTPGAQVDLTNIANGVDPDSRVLVRGRNRAGDEGLLLVGNGLLVDVTTSHKTDRLIHVDLRKITRMAPDKKMQLVVGQEYPGLEVYVEGVWREGRSRRSPVSGEAIERSPVKDVLGNLKSLRKHPHIADTLNGGINEAGLYQQFDRLFM